MKFSVFSKVMVIVVGLFSATANATLIGETISTDQTLAIPGSATIGAGVEFFLNDGFADYVSIDFDDSSVAFTNLFGGQLSFVGFGAFSFSGFDIEITGLSLFSNDGVTGGLANNFSFDGSNLYFDLADTQFTNGADIVFTIDTLDDGSQPIPEPAGIALMLFAAFALVRRQVS